jgi:hypothetical protein
MEMIYGNDLKDICGVVMMKKKLDIKHFNILHFNSKFDNIVLEENS